MFAINHSKINEYFDIFNFVFYMLERPVIIDLINKNSFDYFLKIKKVNLQNDIKNQLKIFFDDDKKIQICEKFISQFRVNNSEIYVFKNVTSEKNYYTIMPLNFMKEITIEKINLIQDKDFIEI